MRRVAISTRWASSSRSLGSVALALALSPGVASADPLKPYNVGSCDVAGKKEPFPPFPGGLPIALPKSWEGKRVTCVVDGKTVTDLVPGPGGHSGFMTWYVGQMTVYETRSKGYVDGPCVRKIGDVVVDRRMFVKGSPTVTTTYDSKTGVMLTHQLNSMQSQLQLDVEGHVQKLRCGHDASGDAIFRDYCGLDQPRKITLVDSGGLRAATVDHGAITVP